MKICAEEELYKPLDLIINIRSIYVLVYDEIRHMKYFPDTLAKFLSLLILIIIH